MTDNNSFEVAPGPWGMDKKVSGRMEVNLPGDVMVLKVKPDETGGLYFSNGEKVAVADELNKNGIGVDVEIHGALSKTEVKLEDFKPSIEPDLAKLVLESWPEGSMLLKNLVVQGDLTVDGIVYRVLRINGDAVSIVNDHYLYIPVKEGNKTDFQDKD
jgi:hypothetical protein